MSNSPSRPVKTVQSASEILSTIRRLEGATLAELDEALELSRSTIHRHLLTLENLDYITVSDGQYRVGLRMLEFGLHARRMREIFSVAVPKVEELATETGEKVWCVTEEHGRSVHLYGASGHRSVKTTAREGQRGHLHQLAAGKAILATFPRERVESIIEEHGLPPQTENTITDPDLLFEELDEISDRGYAFNLEESIPRLNSVGVPITDTEDIAIGSISISGPSNRINNDLLTEELPDLLLGATNEIEINLNYS
jgi:DNA-binding IclR family transcriptional regulator